MKKFVSKKFIKKVQKVDERAWEKELFKKYPKIFQDVGKPINQSCMAFGCECGNGWKEILKSACSLIQNHIDNPPVEKTRPWLHKILIGIHNFLYIRNLYRGNFIYNFVCKYCPYEKRVIPQLVAEQIKEKFGGLRFYFYGGDEFCEGVVHMAESMSYKTCETCGKPGKPNEVGWISTLCEDCRKKRNKRK